MSGEATTPKQLDIFYNTTHLEGNELKTRRISAGRQCNLILNFFKENPQGYFTPFEVSQYCNLHGAPITSIRRALNTLTQEGFLVKTDRMREGDYGVQNHTWKLA
jgi:Fe2+ or Zn2+ uptake regulation protein